MRAVQHSLGAALCFGKPWWMLRTALAGSRASKQIEKSLVFKALAAAAAQALIVAAAWRALK